MTGIGTFSRRTLGLFLFMLLLLGVLFILHLAFGVKNTSISDVFAFLAGQEIEDARVLRLLRLPEAITALLAGSGLAVAGLMMQALFRNPLAGPSVLGISSGASLGVAIVYLLLGAGSMGSLALLFQGLLSIGAALAGAFLVLMVMMTVSSRTGSLSLLIVGLMVSYAVSAIVGVLQFYATREGLQAYVIWGLGSFSRVSPAQLPLIYIPVGILLLLSLFTGKMLNLTLLGENYARNLGLNPSTSRIIIIFISGGLAAIITALTGPIAFIGLVVPHIVRNLLKTSDHRILLVFVVLTGALLALLCSLIARLPGLPYALPVNAVTSIFGAPMIIWFLLKRKKVVF